MIEAQEILYIVLAFCALWVTVFFCWFVYQIASAIRNVNDVLHEVKQQVHDIGNTIGSFRMRFDDGATHLGKIAETIRQAVNKWKTE